MGISLKEALAQQGIKLEYLKYQGLVKLTYADGESEEFFVEEFRQLPQIRNFYLAKLEAILNSEEV